MLIAGGKSETGLVYDPGTEGYDKSIDVVMANGETATICSDTNLPELPKHLEGFGMTSRKNRYIYLCGGIERNTDTGT